MKNITKITVTERIEHDGKVMQRTVEILPGDGAVDARELARKIHDQMQQLKYSEADR